ncbi:MAG: hypothetical protein KIS66_05530 [Fimbriimonadaceae bacterium]|nr:hypothetical protein [Fimbriimonadaceae bacterium]
MATDNPAPRAHNPLDQFFGVLMMAFAFCLVGLSMQEAKITLQTVANQAKVESQYARDRTDAGQTQVAIGKAIEASDRPTTMLASASFYVGGLGLLAGFGVWIGSRWGFALGALTGLSGLGVGLLAMHYGMSGGPLGLLLHATTASYCTARFFGRGDPRPRSPG